MQGTNKVASRFTGSVASDARRKVAKNCSTRISRDQRDTLRISWNVVCELVVIRFVQSVNSTFCTVSRGLKLGIVYQFPAKTKTNETVVEGARAASESFVTTSPSCVAEWYQRIIVPHSTRLCLSASASKPDFLSDRAKTRGRRASQGVVDTTTVHHQSSRNLSRFRLPVSQIQLSEHNFFQAQNVCRQLRHRRLPLLESLLQTKILPPVSIDSIARISEVCLISLPCSNS